MIRTPRLIGAGLVACAAFLAAPAAGFAASINIVGDGGAPQPLTPGTAIRNFDTSVTPVLSPAEGNADTKFQYSMSVTGPTGQPAITAVNCFSGSIVSTRPVQYQGNGNYTATISVWAPREGRANLDCAGAPSSTSTAAFTINASSAIAAPAQGTRLLTRNPGVVTSNKYVFPLDLNPGSSFTEVSYAPGAVLTNGTGPIQGTPKTTVNDPGAATATISFFEPGNYTLLSQAKRGTAVSPYSAPLQITVQDPFDFSSRVFATDSRGPRYTLRGTVSSEALRGQKITMYLKRRGAKKFRKVKTGKVNSKRVVKWRFKQSRSGRYTLRLRFKGSALVRGGTIEYKGLRFYTRRTFR